MKLPTALPMLTGRWFRFYRLTWFAMLALAVTGITAGAWAFYETGTEWDRSFYGAGLRVTTSGGEATVSPLGSESARSGIVPGSRLLAVDARPVSSRGDDAAMDALARALDGADGTELRLTIRAPDGGERVHRVVRGPQHLAEADRSAPMSYRARTMMNLCALVVTGLTMIVAAILLFRRRPGDPVVALLSLALLTLLSTFAVHLIPDLALAATVGGWLAAVGLAMLLLGMTVFPAGRFEPRWSLLALPLLAVIGTRPLWPDPLVPFVRAATVCALLLLLAAIGRRYFLLPPGPQRQQIKWAMLGFAGFILLWLCRLAIAVIDEGVTENRLHFVLLILGTLVLAFSYMLLVLGLMVSLLRYRLYDADAAISRSAVYAGLTLTLVAVFAGTEKLVEALGQQYFGGSVGTASGAVAAGLAALLLVPLHHRLTGWAERRFQSGLLRLRRELPAMAGDLRETASLPELARAALDPICASVRASHAAVLIGPQVEAVRDVSVDETAGWLESAHLNEAVEELDCDRSDTLFPMRMPLKVRDGAVPVGWVLLGPRPDGSFYGTDEREALAEIADPLARAVQIVLLRGRRETELRAELDCRFAALEGLIEKLAPRRRRPAAAAE
ncbi:MAG TPA: hypothetical protein VF693_11565 [Allosphingosinicella sp.]|jgi:hypothetical protein